MQNGYALATRAGLEMIAAHLRETGDAAVDYRSMAEIDRAIEALDREIAAAEGRPIVRRVRVITTKGL